MPVRSVETTSTDPYERGRELGDACRSGMHGAWQRYSELWAAYGVDAAEVRAVGAAVLDPIAAFKPALRAEIAGLAAGSGLSDSQVGALNARTELLALGDQRLLAAGALPGEGLSECSTLVRLPAGGDPLTAQTWDWHTSLSNSWFVWTLRLPGGRTIRTLTEYGIVGKIGVSSHDRGSERRRGVVGVHFNALRHRADTGQGGVPVHVVARRVLDEASTVDEAVSIARAAQVSGSAAVTVTARDGASGWSAVTIELHPGGPSILPRTATDGGSCWLAHTNHFVASAVHPDAGLSSAGSTSPQRLDRVAALARRLDATCTPQRVAAGLATHDLGERSVCVHGFPDAPLGQRSATLAVAVAEPAAGRLHVHAGKPCEARVDSWWSG